MLKVFMYSFLSVFGFGLGIILLMFIYGRLVAFVEECDNFIEYFLWVVKRKKKICSHCGNEISWNSEKE